MPLPVSEKQEESVEEKVETHLRFLDRPRIKHRALLESQAAINLDGACVVIANGKKWPVAARANALNEAAYDCCRVAVAFMAGKSGHGRNLAISGKMQPQAAHR